MSQKSYGIQRRHRVHRVLPQRHPRRLPFLSESLQWGVVDLLVYLLILAPRQSWFISIPVVI